MNAQHYGQFGPPRKGFFATAAMGLSAVAVTLICSGTLLGLYGLRIVDKKTGNLVDLARSAVTSLPELADSLPPVLADLVSDRRQPDYASHIAVSVRLAGAASQVGHRPVVEVRNNGDQVVSLLSMRVIVLDAAGEPVSESNEWAATPIAADHDWRGPLLPGATRRFATGCRFVGGGGDAESFRVEYEITDIRVWLPEEEEREETHPASFADAQ